MRGRFGFEGMGHEGRRGFGRGGRGGLGRIFDHGDLRLVILQLVAEKPRHGYEIIKAIEEKLGGAYSPSPGVVYPTLTMLEEQGFASITPEEGGKKLYTVTPAGEEHLAQNRAALASINARVEEFGGHGYPPASVVRAAMNLRMAVKLKIARGRLTEEQVRELAAKLDETALAIERM
jgi:DNA-binding PadR family transcriptional regulator